MKRGAHVAVIAALSLAASSGARSAPVYAPESRVEYIAGALEALAAVSPSELSDTLNYIYLVERNQCQAPLESMKITCLLEAAGRQCQQRPAAQREICNRVSDVLIVNRSSESSFISRGERFDIMNRNSEYRMALFRELHRRYATLAIELSLRSPDAVSVKKPKKLAGAIDRYCLEVAATRDLSWQYCAAALVWFIGTSGGPIQAATPSEPTDDEPGQPAGGAIQDGGPTEEVP